MRPPFSILVLHGDGSRALRFRVPRWIAYGGIGVVTAGLTTLAGLSGDYFGPPWDGLAVMRRHADTRREIGMYEARVATVRSEIEEWEAVHERIWGALGFMDGSAPEVREVRASAPRDERGRQDEFEGEFDQLDLLAMQVAEEGPRLRELEQVVDHTGKIISALPLRWPLRGPVNSEFGRRRSPWTGQPEQHKGMDIGSSTGTPIEAPAHATVVSAGPGGRYGNRITLDHGNGVKSRYGHLAKLDVKVGERVEKGQVIGRAGNTGRSTGPHLHYEILVEGQQVDPRTFLWER